MLALRVVVVLGAVALVHGFGSGAPKDACGDMVPQHHTPPQKTASPYAVRAVKDPKSNGLVHVTVSSGGQDTFKGFMVQCRVGNTPVGKFVNPPANVKLVDCGEGKGTAATHADKADKRQVVLSWRAPPNLKEKVQCLATVAKNGGEFWVGTPANIVSFN